MRESGLPENVGSNEWLGGAVPAHELLAWLRDDFERGLSSQGCEAAADEIKRLRAAIDVARDALESFMNLPLEADQAWIDQEREDLAIMDQVRAALGMNPWLQACGISLTPNVGAERQ